LPQELRIFTKNSNSLKRYWRQWESRYTIHAGQQLTAKEFRYLWTLRVGPSFTGSYKKSFHFFFLNTSTGQVSDAIHHIL